MWTKSKSAILSLICTRVLIGAIVVFAAALPFITRGLSSYYYRASEYADLLHSGLSSETIKAIYLIAYICFVFAIIALFSLDLLLRNIRKEIVFTRTNVKYIRTISWCCFAIAIIMLCGWPFISYVLIFVAAAAAFFGLLMRVFKNVIDVAREIKDENDYTI